VKRHGLPGGWTGLAIALLAVAFVYGQAGCGSKPKVYEACSSSADCNPESTVFDCTSTVAGRICTRTCTVDPASGVNRGDCISGYRSQCGSSGSSAYAGDGCCQIVDVNTKSNEATGVCIPLGAAGQ